MCSALKVTRQGYYAWKRRPPSAHAMHDKELSGLISQVRSEVRDIYGAPKVFLRLKRMGVRTSRKRVARIMRENGWRDEAAFDLFEYIEVVYNRARMRTALGDLSPAEFEEANWPKSEGRPKAA